MEQRRVGRRQLLHRQRRGKALLLKFINFVPDMGWVMASNNKSSHCISLWEQSAEADSAAGCAPGSCLPFPGLCRILPGTTAWALGLPKQSQGCPECVTLTGHSLSTHREESYFTGKGGSNKSLASFAHILGVIAAPSAFVSPLFLSVE